MANKRIKGFTLVELVAVLVIMAIIALIAPPLILNLINKAKASANKRNVDAYGKAVELSVLSYLMDNGDYPSDLTTLQVEYSGKEVTCNVMTLNTDGSIYLSECSVDGTEIKDSNTEDGWYHYGKNINSSDDVEAPGYDEVYNVGDQVTYNGIDFYVISPSDETIDSVTLLKAEPLTVDEVNTYGAGHINNYAVDAVGTASDMNGYGGMAYYSSATCRYDGSNYVSNGCTTDYDSSEIKYVVDGWSNAVLNQSDLKEDELGYTTRLLTFDELIANLGYVYGDVNPSQQGYTYSDDTPSWVYNSNYWYWTMSQYDDSSSNVWGVYHDGSLYSDGYVSGGYNGAVRPVITLYKSAI